MFAVSGGMHSSANGMPVPPAGCDADAIKLYIGNLPLTATEADLMPLFESFGKVRAPHIHTLCLL